MVLLKLFLIFHNKIGVLHSRYLSLYNLYCSIDLGQVRNSAIGRLRNEGAFLIWLS